MGKIKEVILAEKPNAAKKISLAISKMKNRPIKVIRYKNKVPIYIIEEPTKSIYVLSSVGHIFGLTTDIKKEYPVFDTFWSPIFEIDEKASYTKDYYEALRIFGSNAQKYIVATDYDIEGETIAYNILRYIFKTTNAMRMKFSTLLQRDLISAYINPLKSIQKNLAMAGITRHVLDFYYGINLSRGLMESLRKVGKNVTLSIGRVQGPTLGILVEREKEIQNFIPKTYYTIEGITRYGFKIRYIEEKIFDEKKANEIWNIVKDVKEGKVKELKKNEQKLNRPCPYNLTDLQTDAYNIYSISPQKVLDISQRLYEKALISYPRTSSQKYPSNLPFKQILMNLASIKTFSNFIKEVLKKEKIKPNNGKKEDEAHPAIYPTGDLSELDSLSTDEKKIYGLVVRRFIATLHEDAIRESLKGIIKVKNLDFVFELHRTKKEGWLKIYKGLITLTEDNIPEIKIGDKITLEKFKKHKKKTQPPKRYSPATIIKELEKRNLGTKATRAMILETLYKRGYIRGEKTIKVTPLGMKIYEIMKKYTPEILSEELTRKMEVTLEKIEKGLNNSKEVLEDAKKTLTIVCKKIKENEKSIGLELLESNKQTELEKNMVVPCLKCNGYLQIKEYKSKGKVKRFLSCSSYPKCNEAYPLPQKGKIKATNKRCDLCSYPILEVRISRNKRYEFCINPECKNNFLNKFKK